MRHLDLFSGIGGFAYAIDQVWPEVEHIFCDNDKFCQAVLRKHWPESEIYGDIRAITADTYFSGLQEAGAEQQAAGSRRSDTFILTGGFPCQPFSAAGLRRGTADDRHLWPEMLRVIRLTKPQWVVAENVGGLITWNDGLVFEQVCADLEAAGYEVQPFVIPAVAVNAPHRRDRVWFIGHAKHDGEPRTKEARKDSGVQPESPAGQELSEHERQGDGGLRTPEAGRDAPAANPGRLRGQPRRGKSVRPEGQKPVQSDSEQFDASSWGNNWLEVATELCSLDDGLPAELGDLTLTKAGHRAAQLKAYGNAIVPQVAVQIMKAIKEAT